MNETRLLDRFWKVQSSGLSLERLRLSGPDVLPSVAVLETNLGLVSVSTVFGLRVSGLKI